jgi:putative Ca2+/H+ antiporter (TMEM165/GDT1 family)
MKTLWPIFLSVFLAELGDKTQLATMLFATDHSLGRFGVFIAASAALVLSTLLAVIIGEQVGRVVSPVVLRTAAACGFIAIGAWMLFSVRAQ